MEKFLSSNEGKYRLLRTIVQAIIGVIIANLDLIFGAMLIPAEWRPFISGLVMAVLSPLMARLSLRIKKDEELDKTEE